jgi:hypothetical protein
VATPLRVVPLVQPFLGAIAEGVLTYARAHQTKPERVTLLGALLLRETWAGTAPGYRPKGSPDGTGDFTARIGHWAKRIDVNVHADTDGARAALIAAGWSLPKRDGQVLPGPYATPRDGKGWGRGMWQLDVLGDVRDLIAPAPWPVDRQAAAACAMLAQARRELAPFASGEALEMAVRCRYNASLSRVRAGLEAGNPSIGTTGGDYGLDVAVLESAIVDRWPDTACELPIPPPAGNV